MTHACGCRPSSYSAGCIHDGLPEFVRLSGITNLFNGQTVPFDPPIEIHRDDIEWLVGRWNDVWEFDRKLVDVGVLTLEDVLHGSVDAALRDDLYEAVRSGERSINWARERIRDQSGRERSEG